MTSRARSCAQLAYEVVVRLGAMGFVVFVLPAGVTQASNNLIARSIVFSSSRSGAVSG